MNTAVHVKDVSEGFIGVAKLYRASPPVKYLDGNAVTDHVIVSRIGVCYLTEGETYIFPSDKDGRVLNWLELPGSSREDVSHEEALKRMGYSVT